MEWLTLLLGGALLVLVSIFLYFPAKKIYQILGLFRALGGPSYVPFYGAYTGYEVFYIPRNKLMNLAKKFARQYGPMYVTMGGNLNPEVHLLLPEHFEVILNNTKHIDKNSGYEIIRPWLGTGLLTSTGSKWHSHRKMITPTFHYKILENFVEVFSEKSEILVRKLQQEVEGQGFDVYPYITRCALDIICETAMGTNVHAQESSGSRYVSAVSNMTELAVDRRFRPWMYTLKGLTNCSRQYNYYLKELHDFTKKVINERKQERASSSRRTENKGQDDVRRKKRHMIFLDMLLDASDAGAKLTDEEIREEVDTFMFEGHDTTSVGICWTLFLLGLHKDVQNKVYDELETIFQGSDRPPSTKDLNEMKYLERVIKESLRLYPSVPFIGRHLMEDVVIGKHKIPAGTDILLQIYFLHRNPEEFPNPEKFDPDNFLPERVAKRHPYAYVPFSAGPRNCIGQKFALLEEKTVLSYILRYYKLHSLDNEKNIGSVLSLVLRPEKGIKLRITPRRTE